MPTATDKLTAQERNVLSVLTSTGQPTLAIAKKLNLPFAKVSQSLAVLVGLNLCTRVEGGRSHPNLYQK